MLTWNAAATWWIWNSTDAGSIAAIIANALLMCIPWWGYHVFKNKFGKKTGYISLVVFWMCFEYIHLNWQLSWPWLTMGNVFASHPSWVQWYDCTGVGGGTLWILLVNILVKRTIDIRRKEGWVADIANMKSWAAYTVLVIVPFFYSGVYGALHSHETSSYKVLIVQPNIDPYQKFESLSPSQQIQKLISLSEPAIDSTTQLILWPETALDANITQDQTQTNSVYEPVFSLMKRHPNATLLSGIETFKVYGTEKATATARKDANGFYYDAFNAAVVIKAGQPLQFYHKSKLVPGVESLPTFLNFMAPVFEKFGGTAGGYGRDTGSVAFHVPGDTFITAPIICYESIYGEYVASYVKKGANILTIITNDGWWGNTPGHRQHLAYARLRAIETRRYVARSANTGISAVIDDHGNILETQPWDKAAVISYDIPAFSGETFYVRYGDYLYKIATLIACLFFAWNLILWIRKKISR